MKKILVVSLVLQTLALESFASNLNPNTPCFDNASAILFLAHVFNLGPNLKTDTTTDKLQISEADQINAIKNGLDQVGCRLAAQCNINHSRLDVLAACLSSGTLERDSVALGACYWPDGKAVCTPDFTNRACTSHAGVFRAGKVCP